MSQANGRSEAVFSISAVARLTGVPPATIRTWENRYGLIIPGRSQGGHRLYSQDQADQLRYLRAQLAEGLSAADAHRVLAARLAAPAAPDVTDPEAAQPESALPESAQPESAQPESAQDQQAQLRPAVPEPAWSDLATSPGPVASAPLAGLGRGVVLLAERDRYAAESEAHFLATAGFEVRVAFSAQDALRSLPADEPDPQGTLGSQAPAVAAAPRPVAAVVELLISGGAGLELCRSLHQHGIPVIATSVLDQRDQAVAVGACCFLIKPVDPRLLAEAVTSHAVAPSARPAAAPDSLTTAQAAPEGVQA